MPSALTAAEAAEVTVTVADTAAKAPRRFPPPCWTQDETLVLIDAYRERWYALRRGYLRTADWDAVTEPWPTAARMPPRERPPRSAATRWRSSASATVQRNNALSPTLTGLDASFLLGFSSITWRLWRTEPPLRWGLRKPGNSGDGIDPNPYPDHNSLKSKLKSKNTNDSSPDFGFYSGVKQNKFNPDTKLSNYYPSYQEEEDMTPDENPVNSRSRKLMNGIPKNFPKNVDFGNGFHQEMLPPGLRGKRVEKNPTQEYWDNSFVAPSYRAAATDGLKLRRDAVEKMVESISFLGEEYMKMERAKMELAREMKGIRREMEMKRKELILESQKKVVDAFVKGLFEMKRIKKTKYDDAEEKSH
ncbi:uncharacterized protein LOC142526264 [Primulina tabacum]|uniref:uncharacterized protein LOC142526264 n=1 Tax=Primulina tabacum TaxID=48773 RepID=UPI003F59D7D3